MLGSVCVHGLSSHHSSRRQRAQAVQATGQAAQTERQQKTSKQAGRLAHLHPQGQPQLPLQAAGAEVDAVAQALTRAQLMESWLGGHLRKKLGQHSCGHVVWPQLCAHAVPHCTGRQDVRKGGREAGVQAGRSRGTLRHSVRTRIQEGLGGAETLALRAHTHTRC